MPNYFKTNLPILRAHFAKTQSDIGFEVNKKGNTVGYWEKGDYEPNLSELEKIAQLFELTISELLYTDFQNVHPNQFFEEKKNSQDVHPNVHASVHLKGKKGLQKGSAKEEEIPTYLPMPAVITVDRNNEENVVMVPVRARAGYLNGYADSEFIGNLPSYSLPGLRSGTYRMFEVEGLSMFPTLNGGDVVIGSWVESLADIRDDRLYVVLLKNDFGVVVKRCLNRLDKDGKLILKSDNYKHRDDYPDLVVEAKDVAEVWYCTGYISRQMRPPSEMYNRVIDLEGTVAIMNDKLNKLLTQ